MNADFESLGSIGGAIAATALLIAAAHLVGSVAIRSTMASRSIDAFLLRIPIGLSLIAALGVVLGAAKWLSDHGSIWLLFGLSLFSLLGLLHRGRSTFTNSRPRRGRFSWAAVPALVGAVVTLGPALSYPTGWDELVYHHVLPKRWLADGWPAFYRDLPYSGFPSLGEILFWLMAPIEHMIAPRLLTWSCWMIGLALVFRLLRRRIRSTAAAAITLGFALSSTLLLVSANCYVETIQMMNFAALLLVLGTGRRGAETMGIGGWRKSVVIGVLVGGAAAVKLTGLPIMIIPGLHFAGHLRGGRWRQEKAGRALATYLAVASAVALPFYLRPWLLTGNPFYPYYAQWFSDDPARLEMSRYHHALGAAFGVHGLAGFFAGPLLLAFDEQLYDGRFGWQLLVFVALAALALAQARRKPISPLIALPGLLFAVLYGFWFFTAQQARFAIPAVIVLLLLTAAGLRKLRGKWRQFVLAGLLVATAASVPWRTAGHYFGSWLSVCGLISRTDYVNESTDREYLPVVRAIADQMPPDARVMLLFEHRSFYLPRACVIGTPFFQEAGFTPPEQFSDPLRIMEVLARENASHVVLAKNPRGPDRAAAWFDRLDPLFGGLAQCVEQGKLSPIWETDRYVVFEVAGQ